MKQFIVAILVLLVLSQATAGPAYAICMAGCLGATCGACPFCCPLTAAACAGMLTNNLQKGSSVSYFPTAACAPLLAACFSQDTTVIRYNNETGSWDPTRIEYINTGDRVLALDADLSATEATVSLNNRHSGTFSFMELTTNTSHTLRVTKRHGIVILHDNNLVVVAASEAKVGDVMILSNAARASITQIRHQDLPAKYELVTSTGTVVASALLATTVCDQEHTSAVQSLRSLTQKWQSSHENLLARQS